MEISRATMKKLLLLIAFAALAFTAFQWIDGMAVALSFLAELLSPFLGGVALAFILNVPMRFLERNLFSWAGKGRNGKERLPKSLVRVLSLLLTFVLVALVLMVLVLVIMPQLTETISGLTVTIQNAVTQFLLWAEDQFSNNPQVSQWLENLTIDWRSIDWESILSGVADFLRNGAGDVLNSTISAAKSMVSVLTSSFIAFVFACYILLQKEKLRVQVRKVMYAFLSEKQVEWCLEVSALTAKSFSSFLTGQCLEALILGTMFFIAMTIFNMPYAMLVGVLIAFTALIPIFGAFIGCVIGAFLILMVDPFQALGFVIMFLVLQQIEGNLIYPKVVGSSVGLPSIWVLAAVTIGGSLMGVVGMLIFIPTVSVVYNLFRASVYKRLRKKHRDIRTAERETQEEKG